MHIEETLPESTLNILSNYYLNNKEQYGTHYSIQYRYYKTTGIFIEFFNEYTEQEQQNNPTIINPSQATRCKLIVRNSDSGEYYNAENFDYTTVTCNNSSVSFYKTYETIDNNSSNTASDFYSNNYLDYNRYTTIVQPSPSPSADPEEPNEEGTIESTTLLILISAILMLLVMYKFIGSLFSRGD